MPEPIIMFHCFTDGRDEWTPDWFEALGYIGRWLKNGFANLRIYQEVYPNKKALENDDYEEDCVLAIGNYPW